MILHDVLFKMLVDNGSAKRRRNRTLRTFWRHEHLSSRDHDASVDTAEKVVIARRKAMALTVRSGCCEKNVVAMLDSVFKTKKYVIHMLEHVNHVYQGLSCMH